MAFEVVNYPPGMIEKVIKDMKYVERELEGGRYQNVLRRRKVMVDDLGATKTFVSGEVEIAKDSSTGLSKRVSKEITDAAEQGFPPGYEDLLRDYYKSLEK